MCVRVQQMQTQTETESSWQRQSKQKWLHTNLQVKFQWADLCLDLGNVWRILILESEFGVLMFLDFSSTLYWDARETQYGTKPKIWVQGSGPRPGPTKWTQGPGSRPRPYSWARPERNQELQSMYWNLAFNLGAPLPITS